MRVGKRLLAYSIVILLLISCNKNKELSSLSELTWYDFEYDESTLMVSAHVDFVNEIFFEMENDNIKLIEIFGNEIPSVFAIYNLDKKISSNKWKFTNERFGTELILVVTRDNNLLITRPRLTGDNKEVLTLKYLKQSTSKKELRKIFSNYDTFRKERADRQYDLIIRSGLKYHIIKQSKVK